jgi:hypothetical protein
MEQLTIHLRFHCGDVVAFFVSHDNPSFDHLRQIFGDRQSRRPAGKLQAYGLAITKLSHRILSRLLNINRRSTSRVGDGFGAYPLQSPQPERQLAKVVAIGARRQFPSATEGIHGLSAQWRRRGANGVFMGFTELGGAMDPAKQAFYGAVCSPSRIGAKSASVGL